MSSTDSDDDTPAAPQKADHYPSARTLLDLGALLGQHKSEERSRAAWRLVTGASGNPDFHAVLDFALENELVLGCDQPDPAAANATWVNPTDGSQMVWIPRGKFVHGTGNKAAECEGFSLARHPVTNEQFAKFLAESGYKPPKEHPDNHLFVSHWSKGKVPKGLDKHPIVFVSLFDALAYCKWAGLTLPTEWLWEKAARGPDGRSHPWGSGGVGQGKTKLAQLGEKGTAAVGKYAKVRSPYGCEDLVGNVSEWTLPIPDGFGPGQFPPPWPDLPMPNEDEPVLGVVRGACFLRSGHAASKGTYRRRLSICRRNYWTGFRVAALLPCRPAG
jgi:serine/threonine-protein kinase